MLDFRYLAHGTATDYMFNVVRVPMSFTFEVCEMQSLLILYSWLRLCMRIISCSWLVLCMHITSCIDYQIYGDSAASSKDCFKMFNPTDHSTFNVCPVTPKIDCSFSFVSF